MEKQEAQDILQELGMQPIFYSWNEKQTVNKLVFQNGIALFSPSIGLLTGCV